MNWEYKEYQPEARLNDYIDCIWKENYFSSSANQSRKHPIFPDLSIELLFTQSNIIRNNYVQRSTDIQKSQLSGLRTRVQTFKTDNSAVIAVRIKPEALYLCVDHAIDEITDHTLETKLAFGSEINVLETKLFESSCIAEQLNHINKFFAELSEVNSYRRDINFEKIVKYINSSQGCTPISELSKKSGVSQRTLERKFKRNLGISPKKYSRLVKVVSALKNRPGAKSLTDLSYRYGFSDQMHFVRKY